MNSNHIIYSPAKINLGLKVAYKYPNGYHHIISLFLPISLKDTLIIQDNQKYFKFSWTSYLPNYFHNIVSPFFEGEYIQKNLIIKTHKWLIEWMQLNKVTNIIGNDTDLITSLSNLHIHIDKYIPSPAGLGGGSSNAAQLALYILNKIAIQKNIPITKLISLIKKDIMVLGSDIPFFLQNKVALISGIGEIKKKIKLPTLFGILGIPNSGFETQTIYKHLNSSLQTNIKYKNIQNRYLRFFKILESDLKNNNNRITDLKAMRIIEIENDLFDSCSIAFSEVAKQIRSNYLEVATECAKHLTKGTLFCSMSGSGSSFYVLSHNKEICHLIESLKLKYSDINWYVFSTI